MVVTHAIAEVNKKPDDGQNTPEKLREPMPETSHAAGFCEAGKSQKHLKC
jgi:hypothetical protein